MASTYSTNLKIELMSTGENSGTWGTVTNTNLGTALEQAVVGYGNPNYSSDANLTITLTDSNAAQAARALVLNVTSGVSLTATRELVVPTIQKQYIVQNNTTGSQSITVKTSSGTGVTIPNGKKMHVYVDGTNVVQMDDFALIFNVDNLTLDGNTLSSTNTNGNVVIAPNGTGDVQLDADTVRVGDSAAAVTLTSNGAGALTVTTGGAADLVLNTNSGTNSGSITIGNGTNGNITVATNGTGDFYVDADTVRIGDSNANATITTNGTGDLILNTNSGTNSGSITIEDGVNGNIIIAPNGTGQVQITNAALDLTTIEVTNIKAKDGTAAITIADSTGAVTVSTLLNVDNLRLDGNTISSTDSNGNITLAPNGTGDVYVDADTVRIGDSNANATLTTNGTGDLILNTNAGTNSGSITIEDAANGNILIATNGTGQVQVTGDLDVTTIEVTNIKAKDGTASIVLTDSTGAVGISTAVTMSATTQNIALGTSQTSGTFTVGGTAQTGTQTIDQSTKTHTLNLSSGATENAATKTVNIAANGVSGSTTTITVGSANGTSTTWNGAITATAVTENIALGTSQTSGTFTVGGAAQTGTQTFDQSTKTHTLNIGAGATENTLTKTINIGTGGVSGSTTAINIGSTNGTTVTVNGTVNATTVNVTTLDLTNLEVTNIKAKDGTAAMSIADSTGAVTVSSAFAANGGVTIGDASGDAFTINSSAVSTPNGLNFDSNTFVIDAANNRVGIGLSNPSTTLQVYGEGQFGGTTTSANTGLSVNTRSGDAGSIKVRFDAASTNQNSYLADWYSTEASYIRFNRNASTSASSIAFATSPAGASFAPVANMTLDSSGNLGIGTAAAQGPLEVAATGATVNQYLTGGTGNNAVTGIFRIGSGIGRGASIQGFRGVSSNVHSLDFYAYNSADVFGMRLTSAGNLGVGETNPTYKLEVNGGSTDAVSLFNSTNANGAHLRFAASGTVKSYIGGAPGFLGSGTADDLGIRAVGSILFATAGSGVDMTLDTSGNLGLGVASPGVKLDIKQSGANWYDGLRIVRSTNDNQRLALGNTSGASYIVSIDAAGGANNELLFGRSTNGTTFSESARFTSNGDLLVGTTTSYGRLTVQTDGTNGSVGFIRNTDNNFAVDLDFIKSRGSTASPTAVQDGDNLLRLRVAPYQGSAYTYLNSMAVQVDGTFTSGQNPPTRIVWSTNAANGSATERMRLDASGNLGLGVTPSAWNSAYKAFQFGTTGALHGESGDAAVYLACNAFINSAGLNKYITTDFATRYNQENGVHKWLIAPSGTASTSTINATALTSAQNGNSYTIAVAGTTDFTLIGAANNNVGTSFTKSGATGAGTGTVTQNIVFTQAMTLDASGNLGLGQTSIAAVGNYTVLNIRGRSNLNGGLIRLETLDGTSGVMRIYQGENDGNIEVLTNDPLIFSTNSTERARITSGGYFKASNNGTYLDSTGPYHEIRQTASGNNTLQVSNNTADPYGVVIAYTGASPNGTGNYFLYCRDSGPTLRAEIRSNGGLANYQANDVNLSDQRTKKDIVAAPSYWDKIKGIEIVLFKYKDQTHDDNNVGVIAQQVEQVAPEFVDQDGWGETPEDGVPLKSIYTSDMYHAAIKALQEAMARIEQLEAKVSALEAKGA